MGISATQFWSTSKNGKAMVVMLAQRGDVELCREICEWIVSEKRKAIEADARQAGRNENQAKLISAEACSGLMRAAEGVNDRNCEAQAASLIDALYARHYAAGKAEYDKAMAALSEALRRKVQD
jgi:hypothetical protein